MVTSGGACAVLAYLAQQAVGVHGWLAPGEVVRGLALAETTPGPLITVVQFVAFPGAHRDPGGLDPWAAAGDSTGPSARPVEPDPRSRPGDRASCVHPRVGEEAPAT